MGHRIYQDKKVFSKRKMNLNVFTSNELKLEMYLIVELVKKIEAKIATLNQSERVTMNYNAACNVIEPLQRVEEYLGVVLDHLNQLSEQ